MDSSGVGDRLGELEGSQEGEVDGTELGTFDGSSDPAVSVTGWESLKEAKKEK